MKRFVLFLVLVGCGGSDKPAMSPPPAMMMTPAPTTMQPTPAQRADAGQKCETFISSWCGRAADCWSAADPSVSRTELMAECRSAMRSELDCGAAVGVSASYDRCLREMAEMTCSAVMSDPPLVPAACNGSILVER